MVKVMKHEPNNAGGGWSNTGEQAQENEANSGTSKSGTALMMATANVQSEEWTMEPSILI